MDAGVDIRVEWPLPYLNRVMEADVLGRIALSDRARLPNRPRVRLEVNLKV